MPWNTGDTILGSAKSKPEQDADVIFTAALVGLAIDKNEKKETFRITMEPEIEEPSHQKRTEKDLASMTNHNDACRLVNQMIAFYQKNANGEYREAPKTFTWGFCPTYTAGGMIAGGGAAQDLYAEITADARNKKKPAFLEIARMYLTEGSKKTGRTEVGDTYIGPGAYCGLVVNQEGIAVAAMDTLRTTVSEPPGNPKGWLNEQIGNRWCPVKTVEERRQDKEFVWGMIGTVNGQEGSRQLGMKFVPEKDPSEPEKAPRAIVGYTHGLPRAVYECVRRSPEVKLSPYEMSIGVKTFKLASCMGCSFFMIANGYEPSASHLGGALSWIPLYHGEGHVYDLTDPNDPSTFQIKENKKEAAELMKEGLSIAIESANLTWAQCMTKWIRAGAKALSEAAKQNWVKSNHADSVARLSELLRTSDDKYVPDIYTCCNLLLDAFTFHKKDVLRVLDTLQWGEQAHPDLKKDGWWLVAPPVCIGPEYMYQNPYTDAEAKELTTLELLDLKKEKAKEEVKVKAKAKGE